MKSHPTWRLQQAARPVPTIYGPVGPLRHGAQHAGAGAAARRDVAAAAANGGSVPVRVTAKKELKFGESLVVVGSTDELGKWQADKSKWTMAWSDGDVWSAQGLVPVGTDVKFKLVRVKAGKAEAEWEQGDDRKFEVWGPEFGLDIACTWGDTRATTVTSYKLDGSAPANGSVFASALSASDSKLRRERQQGGGGAAVLQAPPVTPMAIGNGGNGVSSLSTFASSWQGRAPEFVRSKHDKTQRDAKWRYDHLTGAPRCGARDSGGGGGTARGLQANVAGKDRPLPLHVYRPLDVWFATLFVCTPHQAWRATS